MIQLRRATERRHVQNAKQNIWLTFFPLNDQGGFPLNGQGGPVAAGFGALVGFDEMRLPPGGSSEPNRRDEAEIVTYLYAGAVAQQDSTGRSGVIRAGEFKCMTSGRRIRHKDTNASRTHWANIFQITLYPSEVALDSACEQKRFTAAQRRNLLCVVASRDGRKGSLRICQDVLIYSSILDPGRHLFHELRPGRSAWLHVVYGEAMLNDLVLTRGDGVGVATEPSVSLTARENSEILLVDLGPAPNRLESGTVP